MNGSLPPISRLIRATRSAQRAAIFFPVSTEPVKATQSTRSSATIAVAHVARAREQRNGTGGEVREAVGQHQRGERGELRGLAHHGVARRQRRRELPGEQQQRVVPGHDRAHHADRLLHHQRELGGLDRRDHPPGGRAPELGVEVEAGGGPADLVGVLDQRLAALEGHHARELVGAVAQPGGHLVQQLAALGGRHAGPRRASPRGRRRWRRRPARARPSRPRRRSPRWPGSPRPASAPSPGTCSPPMRSRVSTAARLTARRWRASRAARAFLRAPVLR